MWKLSKNYNKYIQKYARRFSRFYFLTFLCVEQLECILRLGDTTGKDSCTALFVIIYRFLALLHGIIIQFQNIEPASHICNDFGRAGAKSCGNKNLRTPRRQYSNKSVNRNETWRSDETHPLIWMYLWVRVLLDVRRSASSSTLSVMSTRIGEDQIFFRTQKAEAPQLCPSTRQLRALSLQCQ